MVTRADKVQSKTDNYITSNNFKKLNPDPTNLYQKQIRVGLKDSPPIHTNERKYRILSLSPTPPNIIGLIKLHKDGNPIRRVANWKNAPAYKLVKHLTHILNSTVEFPYAFNVQNSTQLIVVLNDIKIDDNSRRASFDISNMYANISVRELRSIILNILNSILFDDQQHKHVLHIFDIVVNQNNLSHNKTLFQQIDGLADSPYFKFVFLIF